MAVPIGLSKALLSWEPVRMVTSSMSKQPSISHSSSTTPSVIATLELSILDMVFDYYYSVLLVYDVGQERSLGQGPAGGKKLNVDMATEPVRRLQHAIEKMLVHYPCAGGLLVYNETSGRLEVRYPVNSGSSPSSSHIAGHGSPPYPYGVHFHVAHANVNLADLGDVSIPQPSLDLLYPCMPTRNVDSKGHPLPRFVMAFQVTTFKCGSFTLALTCSHAYADGHTAAAFLPNLCSIARGERLESSLHMLPSRTVAISAREPPSPTMLYRYIHTRKPTELAQAKHLHYRTATRFRFTTDALEALRSSVSVPDQLKVCSRNQALVALLWTAFARVSLNVHGLPRSHQMDLRFPINMRTRGFPMGYMGNAVCFLSISSNLQDLCENPLSYVVEKIKMTMESLDLKETLQSMVDYIELQFRDGLTPFLGIGLSMPSFVNLPFYDTDCGWGPPIYVGRPSQQISGRCIILDHPLDGAWNVLVVFASLKEHACFQESIAKYIS